MKVRPGFTAWATLLLGTSELSLFVTLLDHPTDPSTFFESQDPEMDKFHVVWRKFRWSDNEGLKLWNQGRRCDCRSQRALSQFWSSKIRHRALLNKIKFADLLILRLDNCESVRRVPTISQL